MAFGSITSWEIDGETVETVRNFIFGGSNITADGYCGHEIERHLLLRRKAMTKLDSILKSRDITLSTKVHLVKAMVFPVVMYGCESWTVKKAERRRIDTFELWCWRQLLRVPWTARRSNQSILKETSSGCSLERLMLGWNSNTWATWCEELSHWKRPWCWEGLGAGGEGDNRGWDGWMASLTRCTWVCVNSGSWWWTGRPGVLQFMGSQRVVHDWVTELNWTGPRNSQQSRVLDLVLPPWRPTPNPWQGIQEPTSHTAQLKKEKKRKTKVKTQDKWQKQKQTAITHKKKTTDKPSPRQMIKTKANRKNQRKKQKTKEQWTELRNEKNQWRLN